jgi:hypothetical protein
MSVMNLYSELENIFRKQILDSYPLDWEENYVNKNVFTEITSSELED